MIGLEFSAGFVTSADVSDGARGRLSVGSNAGGFVFDDAGLDEEGGIDLLLDYDTVPTHESTCEVGITVEFFLHDALAMSLADEAQGGNKP